MEYDELYNLTINEVEYSFYDMYDELIKAISSQIIEKGLDFKTHCSDNIPNTLYGDYEHIKIIIFNLLENAWKNTTSGYISFDVDSVLNNDLCKLIITIEDTGLGIKDENIEELFNKVDDSNKLTITNKLLKMMDAKIAVQSKYGDGSKFIVCLIQKVKQKDSKEVIEVLDDNKENKIFNGNSKKILIVDDNPISSKVNEKIIKELNCDVEIVSSGEKCIEKILDGNKYDLIFLDQMMPKMSGEETLNNLKQLIGFNTPVCAISTTEAEDVEDYYINKGFIGYLSQPISKEIIEKLFLKIFDNEEVEKVVEDKTKILTDNGVDINAGLELLGDMETYDETARDFLNESKERLSKIKDYKDIGDMPNYAILVHAMKSDSKYLGFMKLAELSYNHEMASKSNDVDFVNQNYDELMEEAKRIIDLVERYLNK